MKREAGLKFGERRGLILEMSRQMLCPGLCPSCISTSYLICGVQCKGEDGRPLFKMIRKNFKWVTVNSSPRPFQAWGPAWVTSGASVPRLALELHPQEEWEHMGWGRGWQRREGQRPGGTQGSRQGWASVCPRRPA